MAQTAPTGARNESSILFSPSQLGVLSPPGAACPGPVHEGSGLIDIRALAGSLPSRTGTPRPAAARADDVLGIGTAAPLGASLLAVPVPMPADPPRSRGVLAAAALASGGLVIAACVLAVAITRTHASADPLASSPPVLDGAIAQATATGAHAAEAHAPVEVAGTLPDPAGAPVAIAMPTAQVERGEDTPAAATPEGSADGPRERAREGTIARDRAGARPRARAADGTSTPAAAPRAAPHTAQASEPTLGELLGSFGRDDAPARAREPEGETLPPTPSRAEVTRALDAVRPAVSACAGGEHGIVTVSLAIAGPTGRVTSSTVTGAFAGTPVGSCAARAVRGASFPRFGRPSMTIQYPFRI